MNSNSNITSFNITVKPDNHNSNVSKANPTIFTFPSTVSIDHHESSNISNDNVPSFTIPVISNNQSSSSSSHTHNNDNKNNKHHEEEPPVFSLKAMSFVKSKMGKYDGDD